MTPRTAAAVLADVRELFFGFRTTYRNVPDVVYLTAEDEAALSSADWQTLGPDLYADLVRRGPRGAFSPLYGVPVAWDAPRTAVANQRAAQQLPAPQDPAPAPPLPPLALLREQDLHALADLSSPLSKLAPPLALVRALADLGGEPPQDPPDDLAARLGDPRAVTRFARACTALLRAGLAPKAHAWLAAGLRSDLPARAGELPEVLHADP